MESVRGWFDVRGRVLSGGGGIPLARLWIVLELVVTVTALASALAAVAGLIWGPALLPPVARAFLHPALISGGLAYLGCFLALRIVLHPTALLGRKREALARWLEDELHAELARTEASSELGVVLRGALDPERLRLRLREQLSGEELDRMTEGLAEALDGWDGEVDAAGDKLRTELFAALGADKNRQVLGDCLRGFLQGQPDAIRGLVKPITKRLLDDEDPFARGFRLVRPGAVARQLDDFLDRPKGRQWAQRVVGAMVDEIAEPMPGSPAARLDAALTADLRVAVRAVVADELRPVIRRRLEGTIRDGRLVDRVLDGALDSALADLDGPVLATLDQLVRHRAAGAASFLRAVRPDRLRSLAWQLAAPELAALQGLAFASGAAIGLVLTRIGPV